MSMSKKNYEEIARVFRECAEEYEYGDSQRVLISTIAEELCPIFKRDNAKFDKDRFLNACEPRR